MGELFPLADKDEDDWFEKGKEEKKQPIKKRKSGEKVLDNLEVVDSVQRSYKQRARGALINSFYSWHKKFKEAGLLETDDDKSETNDDIIAVTDSGNFISNQKCK